MRRPARPWDSVILPATVKETLLADVEQFLSSEEKAWYASKGEFQYLSEAQSGIPHRRG
jgi:chaperone BCS1